jgi:hypothetical protein
LASLPNILRNFDSISILRFKLAWESASKQGEDEGKKAKLIERWRVCRSSLAPPPPHHNYATFDISG